MSALGSPPLIGGLSVFARGGGFVWHGEIDAAIAGIDSEKTKKTEVSGLVAPAWTTPSLAISPCGTSGNAIFSAGDSMDLLVLGMRFSF